MKKDKKSDGEDVMNPLKLAGDLFMAKMAGESAKAIKRIAYAKEVLLGPLDTEIAPTPYDIIYEEDRVKLKHYRPVGDTGKSLGAEHFQR